MAEGVKESGETNVAVDGIQHEKMRTNNGDRECGGSGEHWAVERGKADKWKIGKRKDQGWNCRNRPRGKWWALGG